MVVQMSSVFAQKHASLLEKYIFFILSISFIHVKYVFDMHFKKREMRKT
jgi:hypothetical protein